MAPKREQAAAVTPATVLIGLSSAEPSQQLHSLSQLAAATAFSQAEVLQCGIPAKLVSLLQQPDKPVKLLACRQLAIYAATAGLLQQATASLEAVQTIWAVLSEYYAAEAAIADALADPAAAKAAQPKKQQAAKDVVEPDEWLPGPSKYLLDASLRTLCSLLGRATSTQTQLQQGESADVPEELTAAAAAVQLQCWVAEQDVNVLVCLARHPSGRVQMRSCRLAHQLARDPAWADAFATAGGAAAALTIGATSTPSNPALQLTALRLLHRLADVSIAAAAVMVAEPKQAADALVTQILEAGAVPAVQGKGKAASNAAEAGTLVNFEVTSVQLAAADLLALLCCKSGSMSQHVVATGGLAALQALLPEPPAPPLTAEEVAEKHRLNSSAVEADGTKSPRKSTASKQPTPRPVEDAARQTPPQTPVTPVADAKQSTPRGVTPAAGNTARSVPQTPHTPHAGSDGPAEGQDTTAAVELLAPEGFPLPVAKTAAPELQAQVLHIIASILHQELVQPLLLQRPPGQASLLRLLLHMFAPAPCQPVSEQPAPGAGEAADAAQLATRADASGHAAAAAATAARAPTPNKAAASTTAAAKSAAPAAGGRKSGVGAAEAAGTAAAGTATPRKGAGTAAGGKDVQKVEPPAMLDPLAPPYSTVTKAAALDCLAHLVQDKQAVALLAAQQVTVPRAANQPSLVSESALSTSEAAAGESPECSSNSDGVTEWQAEAGASMLQQMLEDLLDMGPAQGAAEAAHSISRSNTAAMGAGQQPDSPKDSPASAEVRLRLASMLDGAATVLAGLAEHLKKQQLLQLPMLQVLKALAKCGVNQQASLQAHQAVARALLLLPEALFVPAARPPLPSPPPTPPAPPLPTSQFAWDALDRPLITDGFVLLSSALPTQQKTV